MVLLMVIDESRTDRERPVLGTGEMAKVEPEFLARQLEERTQRNRWRDILGPDPWTINPDQR